MAEQDPITKVHDALWVLLELHTPFTALVAEENRIKGTALSSPHRRTMNVEDLPDVRIVPVQTIPHLQRTSSSSTLLKRFEVQVRSGSKIVENLYELEWEIYRALATWAGTLQDLTWNSKKYVTVCRPTVINDSFDSTQKTGFVGWQCVWTCEIDMVFTTSDLEYVAP